jgi:hypothetical protein
MQELKIYDVHTESHIVLNNLAEFPDAIEIIVDSENKVEVEEIILNIFREDAKQIISFLQNHFNL